MILAVWHWHIEISSKCALRCPRCAREEVPSSLTQTELSLEFFKETFSKEFILDNVEKITFCGDDGDPIYAKDLINVIRYFKDIKPVKFVIVTNGSYKKPSWWKELASVLDVNDHIHFSLDGWDQESNEKYRVNSDWQSIINGVTTLRKFSPVYMSWDAIAFKFNQEHLSNMKVLANELGFDNFQLTLSTKFKKIYSIYPENDILQPADSLISTEPRFQREFTYFNDRRPSEVGLPTNLNLLSSASSYNNVIPLCSIGNKGLYINSQGKLLPCCWVANRYTHNNEWTLLVEQFDLTKNSLDSVLAHSFWESTFKEFKWQECQSKCNTALVTKSYATEW